MLNNYKIEATREDWLRSKGAKDVLKTGGRDTVQKGTAGSSRGSVPPAEQPLRWKETGINYFGTLEPDQTLVSTRSVPDEGASC